MNWGHRVKPFRRSLPSSFSAQFFSSRASFDLTSALALVAAVLVEAAAALGFARGLARPMDIYPYQSAPTKGVLLYATGQESDPARRVGPQR